MRQKEASEDSKLGKVSKMLQRGKASKIMNLQLTRTRRTMRASKRWVLTPKDLHKSSTTIMKRRDVCS